jgi:hypothetical protein
LSIVPRSQLHVLTGRDADIVASSQRAYVEHMLPRSCEKSFGLAALQPKGETKFNVIGTEVEGAAGSVAVPFANALRFSGSRPVPQILAARWSTFLDVRSSCLFIL